MAWLEKVRGAQPGPVRQPARRTVRPLEAAGAAHSSRRGATPGGSRAAAERAAIPLGPSIAAPRRRPPAARDAEWEDASNGLMATTPNAPPQVRKYAPNDLKFIIEDITAGDDYSAGIQWHVECGDGVFFPFSRGCSFARLNEEGKIVSVRRGTGGRGGRGEGGGAHPLPGGRFFFITGRGGATPRRALPSPPAGFGAAPGRRACGCGRQLSRCRAPPPRAPRSAMWWSRRRSLGTARCSCSARSR
jgi:hypothetical protein